MIFEACLPAASSQQQNQKRTSIAVYDSKRQKISDGFRANQPVLTQTQQRNNGRLFSDPTEDAVFAGVIKETVAAFQSIRFLELNPDAMRIPSFPGQIVLGDRGENLSSVLQTVCEDPNRKRALIEWVRELTPMDASDFKFVEDQAGRILVNLVETDGHQTSAYSASDGTLRFLAVIALLLMPESERAYHEPKPTHLYFFEELENGLHPARLYLLLQLLEQETANGNVQIVATTHSPQLLRFLSPEAREYASLVYRLFETPAGHVQRILDIPDITRIIAEQDLARLHESGWFEDAMEFMDEVPNNEKATVE
jgi:hypothetical protein